MGPVISTCIGFVLALGFAGGCASGSLNGVGGGGDLPKEVPADQREKFEVKDTVIVQPSPSPSPEVQPSPEPSPKPKKEKKKKAKKHSRSEPNVSPSGSPESDFAWPKRRPEKDPIWVGEEHVFEISYFGMAAGDFTLGVMPYKEIGKRKVYHIRGTAVSSKVFSLFYRLNDMVETFIDFDGFFAHRFHVVLDETKQARDSLELYDSEKAQTFYWNRWNHKEHGYTESKEWQGISPFSQDSLSALYYLRSIPLTVGSVVTFPVVSEGKSWEAVVTVVRRETMDTPLGKKECLVLKPETKYQGILQKRGDSFLWLTDDDRRFVVRLEAKVRIGTVVAKVKRIVLGNSPDMKAAITE